MSTLCKLMNIILIYGLKRGVNMFSNIFYDAKAIIKGGKEYPKINGMVYFKGCFTDC